MSLIYKVCSPCCLAFQGNVTADGIPYEAILGLANELCAPVGGFGNASNVPSTASGGGSNASNGSVFGSGSPTPPATFTGGTANVLGAQLGWSAIAVTGIIGFMVLVEA